MPKETWNCPRCDQVNLDRQPYRCSYCQAPKPDEQPTPSIADTLRYHGITPCSKCHGEGFIRARTPALEMTATCGRCDGTGEEPKCAECGGSGRVYRDVRDDEGVFMRDADGRVPFPCTCALAREGVAPDVGNNVSMDRADPGDADVKGKDDER